MKAWSSLRSRLHAVAPPQTAAKLYSPGRTQMQAALALQGLPFRVQVLCGTYRADVVLSPRNNKVRDMILMVERPQRVVTNMQSR